MRPGQLLQGSLLLAAWLVACQGPTPSSRGGAPPASGPGSAGSTSTPDGSDCAGALTGVPLRRLTRKQYDNTVRDWLAVSGHASGFPDDDRAGAFPANPRQGVSEAHVRRFMDAAEVSAQEAETKVSSLAACADATNQVGCATAFIREMGARGLRRGITEEQVKDLLAVFEVGAVDGYAAGISLVVEALLQSPSFLYHVEDKGPASPASVPLSGRELAARLSYYLWETLPDQELLSAADRGELDSAQQLRAQAERLLEDDRALLSLDDFSNNWLGLSGIDQLVRDPQAFPGFSSATALAMRAETLAFTRRIFRSSEPTLSALMTSSVSVVPDELLAIYGVRRPPGQPADVPLALNANERAGILTQASVLAAHSPSDHTSPVKRGVFVLDKLLCYQVNLPVGIKVPELPPRDPSQTSRERFLQHEQPGCAGCHIPIDHVGFALEGYDPVGARRTLEAGRPIDETGALSIDSPADGDVNGAVELAQRLLQAPELRGCFVRQWQRFALGRLESDADSCALERLAADFEGSGLSLRELALDVVTQDSFRLRPGTTP